MSRPPTLSDRALNRATLARQLLLERSRRTPVDAVEHLVGLQAQTTHSWYLTLWSRLVAFDPVATGRLLEERRLLRMTAMRGTIHLATDLDAPDLRSFCQPAIARLLRGTFGRGLADVDLDHLQRIVRDVVGDDAVPLNAIADALAGRWPSADRFALAQAGRGLVPLVHTPPRGVWRRSGAVRLALLDRWLGRPVPDGVDPAPIVRRYLAAYGPASVADAQAWSGLTGLAAVFDALRPELVAFSDERGRELLDLPDAPRPDPDAPAPVRLLADYDNVLLAHADRSRFAGDAVRTALAHVSGPIPGMVLVDGRVAASWHHRRAGEMATLVVTPVVALADDERDAVEREASAALDFLAPEASRREVEIGRAA